jgi:hypothetical protein
MTTLQALKTKLAALKERKAQAQIGLGSNKSRGRPKGSKNKPKPKKRGRPRKEKPTKIEWASYPGVSFVQRKPGPKADSHRWVAVLGNQVIGYFKTPEEASKAYNENTKGHQKEN